MAAEKTVRFEVALTRAKRRELEELATDVGISAADVAINWPPAPR